MNRCADAEIRVDYKRVLSRVRDLARNNPYVRGAVGTFCANVVGQGISAFFMITKARGNTAEGKAEDTPKISRNSQARKSNVHEEKLKKSEKKDLTGFPYLKHPFSMIFLHDIPRSG